MLIALQTEPSDCTQKRIVLLFCGSFNVIYFENASEYCETCLKRKLGSKVTRL